MTDSLGSCSQRQAGKEKARSRAEQASIFEVTDWIVHSRRITQPANVSKLRTASTASTQAKSERQQQSDAVMAVMD
jgi:hypothetical protein